MLKKRGGGNNNSAYLEGCWRTESYTYSSQLRASHTVSTVSVTAVITLTQVTVTPLWRQLLLPTIAPQESYLLALMLGAERSIRVVHNCQFLEEIQIYGFNIHSIIKFLRDHLPLTALYGRNCVLLQHHLWTWTLAKGLGLVPKNIKEGSTIFFPKVEGRQSHPFPLHEAEGDCQ